MHYAIVHMTRRQAAIEGHMRCERDTATFTLIYSLNPFQRTRDIQGCEKIVLCCTISRCSFDDLSQASRRIPRHFENVEQVEWWEANVRWFHDFIRKRKRPPILAHIFLLIVAIGKMSCRFRRFTRVDKNLQND